VGIEIGILAVRRSAFINASPERVWREFESLERMRAWFGRGHTLAEYEPRLGGKVDLYIVTEGEERHFGGRIVVWEPEQEVTFEDDWIPNRGWLAPTYITIRLRPALGGTLVELFHHGFERVGANPGEELEGYEMGWTAHHLVALREIVEG
jgi:uncharacterized protein YndB with AHSA1/START domain